MRFVILLFAGLTVWLGKERPGLVLLGFFVAYGITAFGDGLVGVPWADLAGTGLNARWRGAICGITTIATSIIMLLVSPLIGVVLGKQGLGFPNNYALLFGIAGLFFVLSIIPGLFFHELPGAKAGGKVAIHGRICAHAGWSAAAMMDPSRAFILIRMLTDLFTMAAPFYIGYATVQLGLSSEVAVPVLVAMGTIGSLAGALAYTWMGEHNNLLYIRLALVSAVLMPICRAVGCLARTNAGTFAALLWLFGFGVGILWQSLCRLYELDSRLCSC